MINPTNPTLIRILQQSLHTAALTLIQLSEDMCTLLCLGYLPITWRNAWLQHSFCRILHSNSSWINMAVDLAPQFLGAIVFYSSKMCKYFKASIPWLNPSFIFWSFNNQIVHSYIPIFLFADSSSTNLLKNQSSKIIRKRTRTENCLWWINYTSALYGLRPLLGQLRSIIFHKSHLLYIPALEKTYSEICRQSTILALVWRLKA